MKVLILMVTMVVLTCQSCKPEPNGGGSDGVFTLPQEMMDYFVNYEVGTQWIYQDTADETKVDTIELVRKIEFNEKSNNGSTFKGYLLTYQPKFAKDYSVKILPLNHNITTITIDPNQSATGQIGITYTDGKWSDGLNSYDTLKIKNQQFYKTIEGGGHNSYYYNFTISKGVGLVYYKFKNIRKTRKPYPFKGNFVLLKVIKT